MVYKFELLCSLDSHQDAIVALPADVLALAAKANVVLAQAGKSRALAEQLAQVQATFEQARKVTTATGKLPAEAERRKAAELAQAAAKITELIGPEKIRQLTDQMRRAEAAATEWRRRNPEPPPQAPTTQRRPCTVRRGHVGERQARPGVKPARTSTRAGPRSSDDPEQPLTAESPQLTIGGATPATTKGGGQ